MLKLSNLIVEETHSLAVHCYMLVDVEEFFLKLLYSVRRSSCERCVQHPWRTRSRANQYWSPWKWRGHLPCTTNCQSYQTSSGKSLLLICYQFGNALNNEYVVYRTYLSCWYKHCPVNLYWKFQYLFPIQVNVYFLHVNHLFQIGGVRFLFDNIIESVERFSTSTGFGCILAHSMGLGKTLQIVCFCDIFLRHTTSKTVLCIMPINTLQNWVSCFLY